MKGYKALDMNMKALYKDCMSYEMGRQYSITGEMDPYENMFYFCKSIEGLNQCYYDCSLKNSRIFEIEADGKIVEYNDGRYGAEKIRFIKELTSEEIRDYFRQNQNQLIRNTSWYVRSAVADMGYELDILINDKSWEVRSAVARQGYGLDILVDDKCPDVRIAVARQGYGLEKLLHDESIEVRNAVSEQKIKEG